jgi:hypothetical protein
MHYLNNSNKINYLKLNEDYFLKYQFIYGDSGIFHYSLKDNISINQNFKGKPIIVPIDKTLKNFSFSTNNTKHIFYYQLINYMVIKGAEEVKLGEPLTQLIKDFNFPLYYYLKLKNKTHITIDVNVRFQKYMDFDKNDKYSINGYIINKTTLLKKLEEDNIKLNETINGSSYSDALGIGLIPVNKEINSSIDNYLLIEINKLDKIDTFINSLSIVEISFKEYDKDENGENKEYMLPLNKYIIETLNNSRNENKYFIYKNKEDTRQIVIEISSENDNIDIEFEDGKHNNENKNKNEKGFKKYKINGDACGKINFIVKKKSNYSTNYLIKYSYYEQNLFFFEDKNIKSDGNPSNNNEVDYNLTFENITVETSSDLLKQKGTKFFITGTLYTANGTSDSNYILNNITSAYVDKTNISYKSNEAQKNWTLQFKGMTKSNKNYIYDLQLQIHAIHQDYLLNEEYLLYKTKVILDKLYLEEKKPIWLYIVIPIGVVVLIVALFFIIKFIRLKKKNDYFQQEVKSLLFSNDIQKNVLINESQISKNETDFESTFI